jgi:hypothetical protein
MRLFWPQWLQARITGKKKLQLSESTPLVG